jgi:hypothetical protein
MALIRIYQGKSKPAKRKPGWQKSAQEYAEWQSKIASMSSATMRPIFKRASRFAPARWEESTKGWAVVSFHKPPFMCE